MQLLELDDGQVSLELGGEEVDEVIELLRGMGRVRREPRATHDIIRVGRTDFIFTNDWDEPCLLSRDPEGAAMLRAIAHRSGNSGARGQAAFRSLSRG